MSAVLQGRPSADRSQTLLELLAVAQERETQLETMYLEGRATQAQLAELEQVRVEIEDIRGALDDLGYFTPS
jgi:chaperonin cofactor prefoldin